MGSRAYFGASRALHSLRVSDPVLSLFSCLSFFSLSLSRSRAGEEMSDIFIYLLSLAEVLDIDLLSAARAKLAHARLRFPAAEVVGVAPEKA